MNEHEEALSQKLAAAIDDARKAGRADIADYLALKAENDSIRIRGVRSLFEAFIAFAADANRVRPAITMERVDPHSFTHHGANIVGTMLRISYGIRCLTFEAGWTRTPSDGFMRGGALAFARITHFGLPKENADLGLFTAGSDAVWKIEKGGGKSQIADEDFVRYHLSVLIGEAGAA